jgi:hypothetical protein
MVASLRQLGVEAEVIWNTAETLSPEFAVFALDMFEFLLEYEHFTMDSIRAVFGTDPLFSVEIRSENGASGQIPVDELRRINKENYDIRWSTREDMYRVSVHAGRT